MIFGREDSFLNLFAKLVALAAGDRAAGREARFQPVYVGDVADCFVRALDADATIGQRYPLCGPKVYTLRELVRYVGERSTGHAASDRARSDRRCRRCRRACSSSCPGTLMSRDNLASMQRDSVCDCDFPAGVRHRADGARGDRAGYLAPGAVKSRYDDYRAHGGR